MKRVLFLGAAAFSLALGMTKVLAVESEPQSPPSASEKAEKGDKGKKSSKLSAVDGMRKWLRGLTDDQRARVFENLQKWSEMDPDQQQALRNREEVFRKKVQEEIAQACEGLQLSSDDHKLFVRRYMDERKSVEAAIRRDMDERRKSDLQSLKSKLQGEFRGRARN